MGRFGGGAPAAPRFAWVAWLAIVPVIVALPFLFFGLIWTEWTPLLVGVLLLVVAAVVWTVFADDD